MGQDKQQTKTILKVICIKLFQVIGSQEQCFGNISSQSIITQTLLNCELLVSNCQVSGPSQQWSHSIVGINEALNTSGICLLRSICTSPGCDTSDQKSVHISW